MFDARSAFNRAKALHQEPKEGVSLTFDTPFCPFSSSMRVEDSNYPTRVLCIPRWTNIFSFFVTL